MIHLIQIGKNKDKLFLDKINYYTKQLKDFKIIELKDSSKEKEQEDILKEISKIDNAYVFVMSEEGKEFSSKDFSKKLNDVSMNYKNIVFCIGGPEGFVKPISFGNECISLSKMTFTHDMCQLFLVEQIYRANQISKGTGYHKE